MSDMAYDKFRVNLDQHRPRILLVDDQPLIIRTIHKFLAGNYQVFMAVSGAETLAYCENNLPDLVLLDVDLPDINGLEICRRLKEKPSTSGIPVIFITGNPDEQRETACWEAGAVDFVTKPVNPVTLQHRIRAQLTLKLQSDKLKEMAFIDGLTELSNRRFLDQQLVVEWRRAQRYGRPVSVVLLDIDHFKQYNDHYGHQAGDDCLRTVASCVRDACKRPNDIAARYGGEEFCCILPETPLDGARSVAESITRSLGILAIEHVSSPVGPSVSVSVGIASMVPEVGPPRGSASVESSPAELLARADLALYKAKKRGRNRIEIAEG